MTNRNKIVVAISILIFGLIVYYFYPEKALPSDTRINKLVVYKSKRQLLAYSNGQLIKTYKISLGKQPVGKKEIQYDNKTPEGNYTINCRETNSNFHKKLCISYPNKADKANAKRYGKEAGDNVEIHGLDNRYGFIGKFHRWYDWTSGCIALTDGEIDELFKAVKIGTPIEIYP
jgi:murein L,D-transpeptidase YafK